MANEKWSQKPLIEELSETTEFCILDEVTPKNKRINAKTLLNAKANVSDLNNVDNTSDLNKPISTAQQAALDLKAPLHNPAFTGDATLNGEPISTNDLNGTNYVMVYGTGTPEENAAELQAAYNEAKKMPRHLGTFTPGDSIEIYKGQTFVNSSIPIKYMVANSNYSGTIGAAPAGTFSGRDSQSEFDAVLARRVTVIIASGEYNFGASAFVVDSPGINIVSLTGNSDVIINSTENIPGWNNNCGIKVTANDILIKGINCKTNVFFIESNLDNLICEYCIGGNYSFGGGGGTASGLFNNCVGGTASFGTDGTASGTFNNCIGKNASFGGGSGGTASGTFTNCTGGTASFGGGSGGSLSGELINCKLTAGTFVTPTGEGKIYNSIDGNNTLVNYPPLAVPSDSKVKLITLDDPQDSVDDPYSYNLTMDDNGATLIVNDEGLTSAGLIVFDFSNFTTEELSKPFAVTIVGVGYIYAAYKTAGGPVVQLTSGASIDKTIMLCRDPREGFDTPFARILG